MQDYLDYEAWMGERERLEAALTEELLGPPSLGDLIRAQLDWEHEAIDQIYERELNDSWEWIK